MGCYCCVRGCNNNSGNKKKTPNSVVTFHAFPSNPEHKKKWIKAIGRPSWSPPSYARICSAHFDFNQIKHDGCRTRIQDNAVPLHGLPLNSNFEASNVEVCRICLATDVKMYSLFHRPLKTFMESMTTFTNNENIEGLPNFVCYLCAAFLKRSYSLIEKSMLAQTILLDIFAHKGHITKSLVKTEMSKELIIKPQFSKQTVTHIFEYTYNEEQNISFLKTIHSKNSSENVVEKNVQYDDLKVENNSQLDFVCKPDTQIKAETILEAKEIIINNNKAIFKDSISDGDVTDKKIFEHYDEKEDFGISQEDSDYEDNKTLDLLVKNNADFRKNITNTKQNIRKKSFDGLTPEEIKMQKYFEVVKLSLPQQIVEWNNSLAKRKFTSEKTIECKICFKIFAHINSYQIHIGSHDTKRGIYVCKICKIHFKSDALATSHANRAHSKKFYCKTCPKVFNNVRVAKKHHLWHTGHRYKCAECPFTSAHESSLGVHLRSQHCSRAPICSFCGHAFVSPRGLKLHVANVHRDVTEPIGSPSYRCEECDVTFMSEGARRVHFLTSILHKRKSGLCDPTTQDLKKACNKCGDQFSTIHELVAHTKREHFRATTKKPSWSMPDDRYPIQCEHCVVIVNNRKEHWWHVRREHPKQKHSYRAVVTAVCQTCGKGFQNITKLHVHELRHFPPSAACGVCPRVFHDKYAVARHRRSVHTAHRAYKCRACDKTFALRSNLCRHYRVHTGDTPYECPICNKKFKHSTSMNLHVRTVHHKLPHPARSKRKAKQSVDHVGLENV